MGEKKENKLVSEDEDNKLEEKVITNSQDILV
jgi:hypothetical protein